MDAIEQTMNREKTRLAREERYRLREAVPVVEKPILLVPQDKPSDGIIEVCVTVPGGEFKFKFVKPFITQNMSVGRINRAEFRNAFMSGLQPLMGTVLER